MRLPLRLGCSVVLSMTGCASTPVASSPTPAPTAAIAQAPPPTIEPPPDPRGWAQLSALDAPTGREDHTAVWTGSEMIVWGGETRRPSIVPLNSGARYDPSADRWTALSTVNAPDRRDDHAVVWTGTEMIVWGGNQVDEGSELLASGGRYDPKTDRWIPTANGPLTPRDDPTAVWTGAEMIIWGGCTFGRIHEGTGARYQPGTDRWIPMTIEGAPRPREDHSAVWTGSEMIIWGGWSGPDDHRHHFDDGARYDPSGDRWLPMSSQGAPEPREDHTAVWTGSEMIIWGGVVHRYENDETDVAAEAYESREDSGPAEDSGAPRPKAGNKSKKKKSGNKDKLVELATGAVYDPATDTWRPMTSEGAPTPREDHIAVWTGHELLVWGGRNGKDSLADGALYDPRTDRWRPISSDHEPTARWNHTAVFAEDQIIIWGGFAGGYEPTGGRFLL